MSHKTLTLVQEVYFDICDLLNGGQISDFTLAGFQEFETLEEFLKEQKTKLEQIEKRLQEMEATK